MVEKLRGTTAQGARVLVRLAREMQAVADTMEEIHGGRWLIDADHENCFILIGREISEPSGSSRGE